MCVLSIALSICFNWVKGIGYGITYGNGTVFYMALHVMSKGFIMIAMGLRKLMNVHELQYDFDIGFYTVKWALFQLHKTGCVSNENCIWVYWKIETEYDFQTEYFTWKA